MSAFDGGSTALGALLSCRQHIDLMLVVAAAC